MRQVAFLVFVLGLVASLLQGCALLVDYPVLFFGPGTTGGFVLFIAVAVTIFGYLVVRRLTFLGVY